MLILAEKHRLDTSLHFALLGLVVHRKLASLLRDEWDRFVQLQLPEGHHPSLPAKGGPNLSLLF